MPSESPVSASGARAGSAALAWGVGLLAAEAAVLTGLVAFLGYEDVTARADYTLGGVAVTIFTALMAAVLAVLARSLHRRQSWARGPAIALNVLLLPIGYSMFSTGLGWVGVGVMVVGLAIGAILIAPATRAALGVS